MTTIDRRSLLLSLGAGLVLPSLTSRANDAAAQDAATATPWLDAHQGRARLIAARVDGQPYVGLQIELADTWKTYWRNPGDAGGVPPGFDWTGSVNLAEAEVSYPAPARLRDAAGDTIGYKHGVVFPVALVPAAAGAPIDVKLTTEFGICREICIPAEGKFALRVPAGDAAANAVTAGLIRDALAQVPRPRADVRPDDPRLVDHKIEQTGNKAYLRFTVDGRGAPAATIDAFAEAPTGLYLPQPKPAAGGSTGSSMAGTRTAFSVEIGGPAELAELRGKVARLTLVSAKGQSEATIRID